MTNPGNAVGTNAAYGGRTSVNAFNDGIAAYTRGILSGWACEPDTGMTVALGGDGNIRDVAIAEDNAGNKTTINNISGSPINVTLSAAPGANSRIDAIVAYVDNPAQGTSTVADNPSACGLIAVTGVAAADPSEPSDNAIRTAITADGASGPTAYYVVLATVTVANGTTDLSSDDIAAGKKSVIETDNIDITAFTDFSLSEVNTGAKWIDDKPIYKITLKNTLSGNNNTVDISSLGIDLVIDWKNTAVTSSGQTVFGFRTGGYGSPDFTASWQYLMMGCQITTGAASLKFEFGSSFSGSKTVYSTIWYTKQ